jgi:ribosomal protein S18 acetylase RimI-like enzyme
MDDLSIRAASATDAGRIAEVLSGDPGQEATAICGDAGLARRFGMAFVHLRDSPQGWRHTAVAELNGRVVGIIQAGGATEELRITPGLAFLAVRTFGPWRLPGVLRRLRARARVQTRAPAGSYHVGELDVDPAFRNRGIGGAMLDWAEAQARAGGHKVMSLSTTTVNPARRLYERHGFRVAQTLTDPRYERVTGISGRHLMLKDL